MPWERLSPRAAATLQTVALPISFGLSHDEIARQVGRSPGWVHERMNELRAEIERLAEPRSR